MIGKYEGNDEKSLCRPQMRERTMNAFTAAPNVEDITSAWIVTYDENENVIRENIALPVYSTSLGTSVYFGFSFADNFAAGASSADVGMDAARGTEFVEYGTPFYSRAKYLDFALVPSFANGGIDAAHRLPIINEMPTGDYVSTSYTGYLLWNKDGADIGNVAYQLHFVSNDGYIIGSELAKMMPYVRSADTYDQAPMVYFYDTEVDELTGEAHTAPVNVSTLRVDGYSIVIENVPTTPYKAFVIKRPDGACILGKNTENADQVIHFNFKRKR